jgi:xanthine dehydrogenase accessory factor
MLTWPTILEQLESGWTCALVTVFGAKGSAPRESGARMVVRPDGGFFGTIGGGALEWESIAHARTMLAEAGRRFQFRKFALGPELGQCCGGSVLVGFETFTPDAADAVTQLARVEQAGGSFATRGYLHEAGHVERTIVDDATDLPAGAASFSASGELVERFGEIRRPLLLFGAGHVGRALVLALAQHPFTIRWIDSREDAFPGRVARNVTPCRSADPNAELEAAPPGAFVVIMTHSHAVDEAMAFKALALDRFPYVGLIGSATKRARFLKRFRAGGLPRETAERLVCPIGIAGIRSKAPAAIATSVAAQLLQYDEAVAHDKGLPAEVPALLTD